jgi:hypothetical protein
VEVEIIGKGAGVPLLVQALKNIKPSQFLSSNLSAR